MKDILLEFGKASVTASGTAVEAENVLQFLGPNQMVGMREGVNIVARTSRAITEKQVVKIELLDSSDDSTFKSVATFSTRVGETYKAGDAIKFNLPKQLQQYLKAKATVTDTGTTPASMASCDIELSIELG